MAKYCIEYFDHRDYKWKTIDALYWTYDINEACQYRDEISYRIVPMGTAVIVVEKKEDK